MTSRRQFIQFVVPAAAALAIAGRAEAQVRATENDPTAAALGYKEDASKVDTGKYKNYVKGSTCANCNFYQAKKPTDAEAACTALGGKLVKSRGWCTAWVKKA